MKTRSSPKRQRTPLHIQATPSTSAAGDVLTLAAATAASTASGSVVSLNGSADYAATVTAAYPAPMSAAAYPRLMSGVPNHPPPPLYTMTVSSAGQLVDICQNRPTTNGGPAGAPLHSNGQPSTNGPISSSTTAATATTTTGQNASATSSTTGGRNSASPGDAVPQSQPAGPVSSGPQRTSNDLYVHVQPGETLAIRVGSDIQQISGESCLAPRTPLRWRRPCIARACVDGRGSRPPRIDHSGHRNATNRWPNGAAHVIAQKTAIAAVAKCASAATGRR